MPKRGKKDSSAYEKRSKRRKKKDKDEFEYVSDEDRLYGDKDAPDPDSREYFFDDIDEFHAKRDKILIDGGVQEDKDEHVESDEEEVLALDSSDSDDDEIRELKAQLRRVNQIRKKSALGSDLEDNEDQEGDEDDEAGLPDSRAWGQNRKKYYGVEDLVLTDIQDEEGDAVLEEQEALKLQRQMAEQLDDQDFGLDIFKTTEKDSEPAGKEQKIVKDLSNLSKREKLKLLKKESPELLTLIDEFKEKLREVQEKLEPLRMMIQEKQLTGKAADYIHTKFKLNLNYCINIVFYLMLKAKQVPVHNHPVIKRLLQHRNLLKQLEPVDAQLKDEITDILSRLSSGEEVMFGWEEKSTKLDKKKFVRRQPVVKKGQKEGRKKFTDLDEESSDDLYEDIGPSHKPKVKEAKLVERYETPDEKLVLENYNRMRSKGPAEEEDEDDDDDMEEDNMEAEGDEVGDDNDDAADGKRAINYQMEKNKGLTARKKKELRHPRIKHRMKYRKAKIRRRGQIREVRTEMNRYGGEISGVRAGIKRGIRLH